MKRHSVFLASAALAAVLTVSSSAWAQMGVPNARLGNPRLFKAISSFGFGKKTGVELPGEDPGRVNPLKKWTPYSTESISQGYELMVTPLQLARAFCAYANGGRLVQPQLIKGVLDGEGTIIAGNTSRAQQAGAYEHRGGNIELGE